MVRRFRDELAKGRDVPDAIAWSVATTGEAILFSGLTVMVGFCGLFLIGIPFMTSFGLGGALTVASAVLAALALMPTYSGYPRSSHQCAAPALVSPPVWSGVRRISGYRFLA